MYMNSPCFCFFSPYNLPFLAYGGEQVFLGHSGGLDTDGNELPRLVYVSREKRPGFQHHKKAGAMNALVCHLNLLYNLTPCSNFSNTLLFITGHGTI
jgi:hypothetical protein